MEKLKFYNENDMFDGESFVSESIGRESVEADESVDEQPPFESAADDRLDQLYDLQEI